MRIQHLLPFLPLASALVITEESVFEKLEKFEREGKELFENTQNSGQQVLDSTRNHLDDALNKASEVYNQLSDNAYNKIHEAKCDVDSWLEGSVFDDEGDSFPDVLEDPHHDHPPHHGKPHHPPHHGKPNLTIYEMISKSKYTTKLAKLIDEDEELIQVLNGTQANYTVFAPTDAAFEKIPEHGKKPSKEFIKDLLLYHVSDSFYPAGRVLKSYTIPTLYKPSSLGGPQRLTVRVTLKGPAINFYSKLVAVDIFATNGVIHGVDSILVPPPSVASIIDLLPGEFSTLELGLEKTGLYEKMNSTKYPHEGGTFFAPSNFAFQKLGPKINAFLFSKYGQKYLKALLEYHIVVNQTLYSDAFYDATSKHDVDAEAPYYHFDLPTVLGKPLAVDVARYGPFVEIKINAFSRVTVHDGAASDGVIQVVSNVLIPPKNYRDNKVSFWQGEEMSVEEFKERLAPYVDENMEL